MVVEREKERDRDSKEGREGGRERENVWVYCMYL
jgi:hypothetical protein